MNQEKLPNEFEECKKKTEGILREVLSSGLDQESTREAIQKRMTQEVPGVSFLGPLVIASENLEDRSALIRIMSPGGLEEDVEVGMD